MYLRSLPISFSMCDPSAHLSPFSAIRPVQDAACARMRALSIDEMTLKTNHHAIWVLRRNVLRFFTMPGWTVPVRLLSGLSLVSAAKIWMDTEIRLENGEPVMQSRQELCAIDLDTFAIRKTCTVGVTPDLPVQEPLEGLAYTRFEMENPVPESTGSVQYLHLDYCGHANNAELLRFVFNARPSGFFLENTPELLEIHYLNQAFEGDAVQILASHSGNTDFYTLACGERKILECAMTVRPAAGSGRDSL